ncbi:glycerol-3-phosphate 1-O-acyltransferase PlsY [Hirschia baltica]|uniref:Glycerol-3-phosphate acyltransferase n=1 Tax=Hirschia baltica (strain ATCC 49814 / DSM 5838 / IFAM 1418) TaxID=582402 RepID=C6XL71_HIRBI|nr:glycerol-3-phosphate 1-O-acyltransferase PlsY [Hirschia baltica]ACT59670.1 protein of unknown function DUF205 [Hirschia baltica ATCC 49814]
MLEFPIALAFVLSIIGGYLFGSIPFGLVITKMAGLGDIRDIGSGNIGATNVLRTGRKDLALATLLLDAGKAGIAAAIFNFIFDFHAGLLAGAAAFIGHCYPVWLKFKGGKGVATFIGMLFGIMWQVALAFAVCWLSIAVAFRYSSLAALVTAALLPIITWFLIGDWFAVGVTAALSILLFYRHRENIKRLIAGSEEKIGQKKKAKE